MRVERKAIRTLAVIVFAVVAAGQLGCDKDDAASVPGSDGNTPGGTQPNTGGVLTINKDPNPNQEFKAGTEGEDFGISTKNGVTVFNIPSASAKARGLLSAEDYSAFEFGIADAKSEAQNRLGPDGTGTFVTSQAISHAGYFFIYSDEAQKLPPEKDDSLPVSFNQVSRMDYDFYAFDKELGPTQLNVLTEGAYKVSYSVTFDSEKLASQGFKTWLELDGAEVVPSKTHCLADNNSYAAKCTTSTAVLVKIEKPGALGLKVAGSPIKFPGSKVKAKVVANGVWVLIEKI